MAQIIIKGNLNAVGYEQSLNQHLLPSLKNPSVLIMDNSSIHRKKRYQRVSKGGHQLLFLPKYSLDLNDIEHDFSTLKRARMYSPISTYIDEIFCNYCVKYSLIFI